MIFRFRVLLPKKWETHQQKQTGNFRAVAAGRRGQTLVPTLPQASMLLAPAFRGGRLKERGKGVVSVDPYQNFARCSWHWDCYFGVKRWGHESSNSLHSLFIFDGIGLW